MSKRSAALFYDRQSKLFSELKEFVFVTLELKDDE